MKRKVITSKGQYNSENKRINGLCKAELPHPVSAFVFRIALRFRSKNFSFHMHQQTKVNNKKTQRSALNACINGMCKRAFNVSHPALTILLQN